METVFSRICKKFILYVFYVPIIYRFKSSSTSRINSNSKTKKPQRPCSPVENLRRQLQKLEDLEDQFPENPQSDTYHLRYPFSDGQKFEGSSELEFFRHRIHLERDSIKRAKESLRSQKSLFQQRQKELKLKHGSMARHTLQQLCQVRTRTCCIPIEAIFSRMINYTVDYISRKFEAGILQLIRRYSIKWKKLNFQNRSSCFCGTQYYIVK